MDKRRREGKKITFFQSTIVRIVAVIIALVLPINIMTLVLSNMVLEKNQEEISKEIQGALDNSADNLGDILKRSTRKMIYLSYNRSGIVEMANKELNNSDKGKIYSEISKELEEVQLDYPWIDLFYFRFPMNNISISSGYPGISTELCRETIEEISREENYGWNWSYTEMEGKSALLGISSWRSSDFGMILNLERTLERLSIEKEAEGRVIFFTNKEKDLYTDAGEGYIAERDMTLEEMEGSQQYQVFYSDLEEYDLRLVEVVDWKLVNQNLPVTIKWLQSFSIITTVLVIPVLLLYVRRWISKPLNQLTKAIDRIEGGDLDYRIPEVRQGREFVQINHSFNDMMNQVNELKIDVYEKELEQKNIRMRYLSQQVQPHFILNAMNILYSYEPEEYALSQKMILCISKYFRYIVKVNAKFVELAQEMDHIKNYFEIQRARFPGLFFSIVEYEEGLRHALIPPLLIQNFAENAIKHSLKIGQKITIFVVAEYYEDDTEEPKMRIRLADTGVGISDEILEKIEIFKQTGEPQEGMGVGIQNSIERLKYIYGGENSFRIWRDENYSGTNVEMILPIHFFDEEDSQKNAYFID